MYRLLAFPLLFTVSSLHGQNKPSSDSLFNDTQRNFAKSRQLMDRLMDSTLHPIKYAKTIEDFLIATFPINSNKDGRWVYYKDIAKIQKIEKTTIGKILPDYNIYSVNLTNYLGWHINQGTCLVFVDSIHGKITYAKPLWYGGVSEPLIKLFIGKSLNDKDTLLSFLTELNELMQIGSSYKFRQTSYSDTLATFDLGYFKGDSYTTGGNGTSSTVNYTQDGVWRKIYIVIKDFAIVRYTSVNP
jgi:hypothetical protein